MAEIRTFTDYFADVLAICERRTTPLPRSSPSKPVGEPLLLSLHDAGSSIVRITRVVVSSAAASHLYAWSALFVLLLKLAPGLRLLHKALLSVFDGPRRDLGGADSGAGAHPSPSACPCVTAADNRKLSDLARKSARKVGDVLRGSLSLRLFVAASDECAAAWTASRESAHTRAENLLLLLARLDAATRAVPSADTATAAAADLAALLEQSSVWEKLVADVLANAPVELAGHLRSIELAYCDEVERDSPCGSDMSEDGPEGHAPDSRRLSFSPIGGAARPNMAFTSPPAGAAAGATAVDVPMGGARTETPREGFR